MLMILSLTHSPSLPLFLSLSVSLSPCLSLPPSLYWPVRGVESLISYHNVCAGSNSRNNPAGRVKRLCGSRPLCLSFTLLSFTNTSNTISHSFPLFSLCLSFCLTHPFSFLSLTLSLCFPPAVYCASLSLSLLGVSPVSSLR